MVRKYIHKGRKGPEKRFSICTLPTEFLDVPKLTFLLVVLNSSP